MEIVKKLFLLIFIVYFVYLNTRCDNILSVENDDKIELKIKSIQPQNPTVGDKMKIVLQGLGNNYDYSVGHLLYNDDLWQGHADSANKDTIFTYVPYISNTNKYELRFWLGIDTSSYTLSQSYRVNNQYPSGINVIHNDGNDQNILINISDNQRNGEKQKMSLGIIDFGDMVFSYTVNDIAVASAYVMLHKKNFMEAASHMIKGYNEIINLTNREFKAIPHLIYMRLCMSVAISAFQKRQNPENKYLTISEEGAWKLLKRLKKSDLNFMNFISK